MDSCDTSGGAVIGAETPRRVGVGLSAGKGAELAGAELFCASGRMSEYDGRALGKPAHDNHLAAFVPGESAEHLH